MSFYSNTMQTYDIDKIRHKEFAVGKIIKFDRDGQKFYLQVKPFEYGKTDCSNCFFSYLNIVEVGEVKHCQTIRCSSIEREDVEDICFMEVKL